MVIDLLKTLVSIPSASGSEAAIATKVESIFRDLHLEPLRSGDNVWAQVGSGNGPRLLLNSHIDTVPASPSWTIPPHPAQERDGKIYGLGSNDAKASVSAMIAAVVGIREKIEKSGGTVILAMTANEEMGRQGLETIVEELKPLDAGIVGEPNGMEICIAQRGSVSLHLSWRGKSAHAAHGSPDNAMKKALEDLLAIERLDWPKADPMLGKTRCEVTQVHAGDRVNVIPDRVTASVDIRYSPAYDAEEIVRKVREVVRGEVKVHSDRRIAVSTSERAPIVQAAKDAQPQSALVASGTSSDWVFLKGIDAIKMGPGNTKISHTADEFIPIEDVVRAVKIYQDTILRFLSNART